MAAVPSVDPTFQRPAGIPQPLLGRGLIALILFVIPLLSPILGPLAQLAVPGLLVALVEGLARSRSVAVILAGGAGGLGVLGITGNLMNVVWLVEMAGLTLVLCACRHKGWPEPKAVLASFFYLVLTFLFILTLSSPHGLPVAYEELKQAMAKDLEQNLALYRQVGAAGPDQAEFEQWLSTWRELFFRFLPSCLGLSFLTVAVANISVAKAILARRTGVKVFEPPFVRFRLPEALVWGVIGAGGVALWVNGDLRTAAENLLVLLGGVYCLQGLAVLVFHLARLRIPRFVRWLCGVLLSIQWYGLLFLMLIGLSDVWFDLRKQTQRGSPDHRAD